MNPNRTAHNNQDTVFYENRKVDNAYSIKGYKTTWKLDELILQTALVRKVLLIAFWKKIEQDCFKNVKELSLSSESSLVILKKNSHTKNTAY